MEKIKKNTHIVIKREDVYKYLTEPELISLEYILNSISIGRARDGRKQDNTYYICNTDEPYADKVLEVILNQGNDWIPCDENLPNHGQTVIFLTEDGMVESGCYDVNKDWCVNDSYFPDAFRFIEWQPLPEPPIRYRQQKKHIKN